MKKTIISLFYRNDRLGYLDESHKNNLANITFQKSF